MTKQPIQFELGAFHASRFVEFEAAFEGEVLLEIEMILHSSEAKILIGAVQMDWSGRLPHLSPCGIAISLDSRDGVITDAVNGQGVIGMLEAPIELGESVFVSVEIEKHGKVHLPKVTIGEEKFLYPAIYLPQSSGMSFIAGSMGLGHQVDFANPHFQVLRHRKLSA